MKKQRKVLGGKKAKSEEMARELPLAAKWRPMTLDQVVGQESATNSLATSLAMNRCPKAMLFHGPRGSGKTTTARIVAYMLDARGRDVIEYNVAHTGGKDRAREIADNAYYAPFESASKVYIFDECHRATKEFQDALLKVVEEPPSFVYFIFCTTEADKLLATVRSRCTPFEFKRLKSADMKMILDRIVKEEGEDITPLLLREIISTADGDCRTAINLLEMVLGVENPDIDSLTPVKKGDVVIELCRALLAKKGWKVIAPMVKDLQEEDPEGVRRTVLQYMNRVLIGGDNHFAYVIMATFSEPWYDLGKVGIAYACYTVCTFEKQMKRGGR